MYWTVPTAVWKPSANREYAISTDLIYTYNVQYGTHIAVEGFFLESSVKRQKAVTSMEVPRREPISMARIIMGMRFLGGLRRSKNSVSPPVKSSRASDDVPPLSASYDPCSLKLSPLIKNSKHLQSYSSVQVQTGYSLFCPHRVLVEMRSQKVRHN